MRNMAISLEFPQEEEVAAIILHSFSQMMRQYMKDSELIPKGNLAEVRFEDLERCPLSEREQGYSELALPGSKRVREPTADYLRSLSDYRKNAYRMDHATIDLVD